jgi:hypothetical protein
MMNDWRRLSREVGFSVVGDGLRVTLGEVRSQTVYVEDSDDHGPVLRIWSVAAPARVVQQSAMLAWGRNRTSDLVGYKTDGRGRLIGEAWVPTAGLDAEEWRFYVNALAQACDRTEYLLTGSDEL